MKSEPVIRILVVDDHPLLRDGITALIADETDMEVVGEASNGREAIERFKTHRPDITLMDLQMPQVSGLEAILATPTTNRAVSTRFFCVGFRTASPERRRRLTGLA
jgi:YesN/AraC family two-component response regulator